MFVPVPIRSPEKWMKYVHMKIKVNYLDKNTAHSLIKTMNREERLKNKLSMEIESVVQLFVEVVLQLPIMYRPEVEAILRKEAIFSLNQYKINQKSEILFK